MCELCETLIRESLYLSGQTDSLTWGATDREVEDDRPESWDIGGGS